MKDSSVAAEAGFTLIELLIVVAIIGIISMIALPQLNNYRCKAFNAGAMADLKQFQIFMESSFTEEGEYPAL